MSRQQTIRWMLMLIAIPILGQTGPCRVTGDPEPCVTDAQCNDGNGCTSDRCFVGSGVCVNEDACDSDHCVGRGNTSVCVECVSDSECDNSDVCDGAESCNDGQCRAGVALNCDDADSCTSDTCNSVTGCVNTFVDCNGVCHVAADCDDGDVCTDDACVDNACQNSAVRCSSGGTCDQDTGNCVPPVAGSVTFTVVTDRVDDVVGVVTFEGGADKLFVLGSINPAEALPPVTGGGFIDELGNSTTFWLGSNGLPETVVVGDTTYYLRNFSSTSVDVIAVSADGRFVLNEGVPVDESLLLKALQSKEKLRARVEAANISRKLNPTLQQMSDDEVWRDYLHFVGITLKIVCCATGIATTPTGVGAVVTATCCVSLLITLVEELSGEEAPAEIKTGLSVANCVASLAAPSGIPCKGLVLQGIEASIDAANEASEDAQLQCSRDLDGDGIGNCSDNCPSVFNPEQTDLDGDLTGDACDLIVIGADADGDGVPDIGDNCLIDYNPDQRDADDDGVGDACESSDPPSCGVFPQLLDFVQVDTDSSSDLTFEIGNNGGGTIQGTVSESCSHFSIVSGSGSYSLGAGEIRRVTVRFEPTSSGQKTCRIELGSSECGYVSAVGVGGNPPPTCSITWSPAGAPSTANYDDFGTRAIGTDTYGVFTIRNVGGGTLSGTVTESCPDYSVVVNGGSFSLAPNESRGIGVYFTPTSAGTHQCTFDLGTICGSTIATGVGEGDDDPPNCGVFPQLLDFVQVDTDSSSDLTFEIGNYGGGTIQGTVSESCSHFSIVSGSGSYSLSAGEVREVTVRFKPTSSGQKTCRIELGSSECGYVSAVGVGGNPPPTCSITWAPAGAPSTANYDDFGTRAIGTNTYGVFTIRNIGGGTLSGTVTESCPDYSVVVNGGSFSLAPNESRGIGVYFTPTSAGTHRCTFGLGSTCGSTSATGVGQ